MDPLGNAVVHIVYSHTHTHSTFAIGLYYPENETWLMAPKCSLDPDSYSRIYDITAHSTASPQLNNEQLGEDKKPTRLSKIISTSQRVMRH